MDDITKQQHIARLILKERVNTLSKQENDELSAWLEASENNQTIYQKILTKDFTDDLDRLREINSVNGYKHYKRQYPKSGRKLKQWYIAAAMITISIISTLFIQETKHKTIEKHAHNTSSIIPGSAKAFLILSDGSEINLTAKSETIVDKNGVSMENNGLQISYTPGTKPAKAKNYNELRIPIGGEYSLVMEDGTKVWLNSQTTFKYPVPFTSTERDVYLSGEAYFEVAQDSTRPFHIKTCKDVSLEVLGTCFNLKTYPDEQEVETVLEKGAVRMNTAKNKIILVPGDKINYNCDNENVQITHVDAQFYSAWRFGQFIFDDEPIANILTQLSRWYGTTVFYQDEDIKNVRFSGSLKRYDNIHVLLRAIEAAGGITINVQDHQIFINWCEQN